MKLGAAIRAIVFERDDGRCVNCGSGERLTIDHVVPVAEGGVDDLDNLQTLCISCNSRKGKRAYIPPPRVVRAPQINFRIPASLRDAIDQRAEKVGRSRNDWIEAAVRWALDQPEKTVRVTKKI